MREGRVETPKARWRLLMVSGGDAEGLQQGGDANVGFFLVGIKRIQSSIVSTNLKTQGPTRGGS